MQVWHPNDSLSSAFLTTGNFHEYKIRNNNVIFETNKFLFNSKAMSQQMAPQHAFISKHFQVVP